MKEYKTEQEEFWVKDFGDEYIKRTDATKANIMPTLLSMYTQVFKRTKDIKSIIEFGSNIGFNLEAIKLLLPDAELSAVEINPNAVEILKQRIKHVNVYHQSIFDFSQDYQRDFTLIKTVLIHINPEYLNKVYNILYQSSKKYICLIEYYNPTPVIVSYRGHEDRLFKRDFAGEMLDRFLDLNLVDYGFVYQRDNQFPIGDVTWFLLEKKQP
jgi:pseudaminic acid biosynthesis-associated methylase